MLLDLYRELRDPAVIAKSQDRYMRMLLPPEGQRIYEAADRVRNCYKQKLRIFTNLNGLVRPPGGDCVLLLVGSGHLDILNDCVTAAPYACWVDPMDYFGASAH